MLQAADALFKIFGMKRIGEYPKMSKKPLTKEEMADKLAEYGAKNMDREGQEAYAKTNLKKYYLKQTADHLKILFKEEFKNEGVE